MSTSIRRRRAPQGRPASTIGTSPVYPTIEEIVRLERGIRRDLRSYGIAPDDIDDVVQLVQLGAWRSARAGRYRPSPTRPAHEALGAWLHGIMLHHVSHYLATAWRVREVLHPDPVALAVDLGRDPERELDARAAVRWILRLGRWDRGLLAAAVAKRVTPYAQRRRRGPLGAYRRLWELRAEIRRRFVG